MAILFFLKNHENAKFNYIFFLVPEMNKLVLGFHRALNSIDMYIFLLNMNK